MCRCLAAPCDFTVTAQSKTASDDPVSVDIEIGLPDKGRHCRAGELVNKHADEATAGSRVDREAAVAHWYQTHHQDVYRFCLARLGNVGDAEDVCEDVF